MSRRLKLAVGDKVLMGSICCVEDQWTFQIVAKLVLSGEKFLIAVKLGIDITPYQIVLLDADYREVDTGDSETVGFFVTGRSRDSRTLLEP